jgi:branched-chain amino acid transport system permease protein
LATTAWLLSPRIFGDGTRFDWLPPPRVERPDLFGVIDVRSESRYYLLCLVALALVVVGVVGIRRSRTGRALVAIRENDRAASAFGVNPRTTTLQAFASSGFLAAFAGALFVHQQNGLQLDSYSAGESLVVFTMVVIGGLGSIPGALLGGLVFGLVYEFAGTYMLPQRDVAIFAILILVLVVKPTGLMGREGYR